MGFFWAFFPYSGHIEDIKSVEFASVAICSTFYKMTGLKGRGLKTLQHEESILLGIDETILLYIILYYRLYIILLHSKKYWVVLTYLWVKYGQTQPLG